MTLSLDRATIIRAGSPILDAVSFELKRGQLTCIVGPNGAGKSTALKCLSGDLTPDKGQVWFDDQALSSFDHKALARKRAVMPQHTRPAFDMQVWEVVMMGRSPFSESKPQQLRAAEDALRQVGALPLAHRDVATLSGGERQRAYLAKALAQARGPIEQAQSPGDPIALPAQSAYLLLDEPTSALDLGQLHAVMTILRDAAALGLGVVCVMHDLAAAKRYGDYAIILDRGHVVAKGPPSTCLTQNRIADVYGVDPATANAGLAWAV